MAERKTLTEKQKAFCRFCAGGMSPKEAAKLAGYSNAGAEAKRLMQRSKIQKAIEKMKGPKKEKAADEGIAAEKEEILSFLTEVMRDNEEADLKTRMKAAELLGKRESLFEKGKGAEEQRRVVIVDDIP